MSNTVTTRRTSISKRLSAILLAGGLATTGIVA